MKIFVNVSPVLTALQSFVFHSYICTQIETSYIVFDKACIICQLSDYESGITTVLLRDIPDT